MKEGEKQEGKKQEEMEMKKEMTNKKGIKGGLDNWVTETHKGILKTGFKFKELLFEGDSPYQNVKIVETNGFGKMLLNDSVVMTCERDEFIYHEMIAHVPMFTHPNPQSALIIGGGDGGTARELLKHQSLKRLIMVEIDSMVVSACKKHLKSLSASLENPRLELKIEDGADFISKQKGAFDIIVVDSSDPIGPSSVLFGENFYKNACQALKSGGILVAQAESSFYEIERQKTLLEINSQLFKQLGFYNYSNLSYPAGPWSFLFASKGPHPLRDFQKARFKSQNLKLRYYNEEMHRASFAKAQFVKEAFRELSTL